MGKGTSSAAKTYLEQNGLPNGIGRTSMPSFSYQPPRPVTPQYGYGSPYPGVSSRPTYQPAPYMPSVGLGALNIPSSNVSNFFAQQRFQLPAYQQVPVYQQPRNPYVRMPTYVPPAYSFQTPEQLWRRPITTPITTPVTTPTTPTTPTEPQQPDPGPPYSND